MDLDLVGDVDLLSLLSDGDSSGVEELQFVIVINIFVSAFGSTPIFNGSIAVADSTACQSR
jgi:hypothetical protein